MHRFYKSDEKEQNEMKKIEIDKNILCSKTSGGGIHP